MTKNNQKTIQSTLESITALDPIIVIGDYSSTDGTLEICSKYNAKIYNVEGKTRNQARSFLNSQTKNNWNLWIEPWETWFQSAFDLDKIESKYGYVRVIRGQMLTWEIRLWNQSCNFINPIFEQIEAKQAETTNIILYSHGGLDDSYAMDCLQKWKLDSPLSSQPYYYQACLQLAKGRYDDFLSTAEHFLFLEKENNIPVVMTRYYYAMVQLMQKRAYKPALQNLNLCLCTKPLMAEFWCLTGDVYYHLFNKFNLAKEFYENAILLGSKRLASDRWPMHISKYNKYPKMMIESCEKIIKTKSNFTPYTVK